MKRSVPLSPLSHDHFEGLHLARRLRADLAAGAAPGSLADDVLRFWAAGLVPHFAQEETLLVAPLGATGGAALAARMVADHRALRAHVEAVRAAPASPDVLAAFADALQQHIRFEEREVFPYLERHLEPGALGAIGEALRQSTDPGRPPGPSGATARS